MSEVVNFDNVDVPEQKQVNSFKRVTKGAKTGTITNVEDVISGSGTPGIEVTFDIKEDEAEFKHKFWLSPAAKPRVQSLMIGFTGSKLTGNIDTAEIAAKLVGKTAFMIVDARTATKVVNGKSYDNEYPDLRYADFASLVTPFKDSDARVKVESAPNSVKESAGVLGIKDELDQLPF